jgi:hypothetical protein
MGDELEGERRCCGVDGEVFEIEMLGSREEDEGAVVVGFFRVVEGGQWYVKWMEERGLTRWCGCNRAARLLEDT